jgi:hypothetical protein
MTASPSRSRQASARRSRRDGRPISSVPVTKSVAGPDQVGGPGRPVGSIEHLQALTACPEPAHECSQHHCGTEPPKAATDRRRIRRARTSLTALMPGRLTPGSTTGVSRARFGSISRSQGSSRELAGSGLRRGSERRLVGRRTVPVRRRPGARPCAGRRPGAPGSGQCGHYAVNLTRHTAGRDQSKSALANSPRCDP